MKKIVLISIVIMLSFSIPRDVKAIGGCDGPPPTCGAGESLVCNCLGPWGPMGSCTWACEDPTTDHGCARGNEE